MEHLAAVPAQAVQVQPAPVHAMLVSLASHASGVPEQAPALHLQPGTLTHVSVVTRLAQDAGWPLHAGVHEQPELPQSVEVTSAEQAVGAPIQEVVKMQPVIFAQAVESAAVLQSLAVPEQLSVEKQPLALPHCCAERLAHAVASPVQVGAPPEPDAPPAVVPPDPL